MNNEIGIRRVRRAIPAAVFCVIFLVSGTGLFAQDNPAARVDEYIQAQMALSKIPGVALGIYENGKIKYAKGYGLANVEHRVPVKVNTIFQSGSVGKQFTATAVMLLVEDGKIALDDKITKYFPDAPETWSGITVRHILTHTSGMTDYPEKFDYRKDYTEDDLLTIIKARPLAFEPGEKWSYSNLGYVTLGILIRKVSGMFYGDFLNQRVFGPLGMTSTRIISERDIIPNRASGYELDGGEIKNQEWVSPSLNSTADGALYMTIEDMAKWDAALYGEEILKRASLELMWTPVKLNSGEVRQYGFGWSLGRVKGGRRIGHGGSWQGFKTSINRYVDKKITIMVFANLADTNMGKLADGIAEAYDPELAKESN